MLGKVLSLASVFSTLCLSCLRCPSIVAQPAGSGQEYDSSTVLHIESREAVIDVVARDRKNLPIRDLAANEFEVYETAKHGRKIPLRILYLRIIDPEQRDREEDSGGGFHVSSGAVCALDATMHYQIAVQASPEAGYHTVVVKTSRPRVDLTFRRRYYVGYTRDTATRKNIEKLVTPEALYEAACYHPLTPPTLMITARELEAPGGNSTRYAVQIKPESLSQIGINGAISRIQLDVGMCVFDDAGDVADYEHATVDHQLNSVDLAQLPERGYTSFVEAPGPRPPALTRMAVLDRNTGNIGVIDVARPLPVASQTSRAEKREKLIGDIRAFGSVTPGENAFCGDVYEISTGTTSLQELGALDPVGSLYTNTLDVPDRDITKMGGIPGITHSSVWFGIDYFGRFYITKPGEYAFELRSDDGSQLEIDDRVLIDLDGVHPVNAGKAKVALSEGWHSIHVPYFQGPPTSLALVLSIQPPGEAMHPMNLNEFAGPAPRQGATTGR